jgi:hypothetical protein
MSKHQPQFIEIEASTGTVVANKKIIASASLTATTIHVTVIRGQFLECIHVHKKTPESAAEWFDRLCSDVPLARNWRGVREFNFGSDEAKAINLDLIAELQLDDKWIGIRWLGVDVVYRFGRYDDAPAAECEFVVATECLTETNPILVVNVK